MATHLTRGELKRDELGEAVGASVHWAERHWKTILASIGALAVVVLVGWGVFAWRGSRLDAANRLLADALKIGDAQVVPSGAKPNDPDQPTFATAAARDAQARPLFEAVITKYGGTGAGAAAHLWLAKQAYVAGDTAAARKHWEAFLAVDREGALAAEAQRDLWVLDRNEGKGETALGQIRAALENGEGPLPADVLLWELAETERKLGHDQDAHATYQRIVEEHANSPYAPLARRELVATGNGS